MMIILPIIIILFALLPQTIQVSRFDTAVPAEQNITDVEVKQFAGLTQFSNGQTLMAYLGTDNYPYLKEMGDDQIHNDTAAIKMTPGSNSKNVITCQLTPDSIALAYTDVSALIQVHVFNQGDTLTGSPATFNISKPTANTIYVNDCVGVPGNKVMVAFQERSVNYSAIWVQIYDLDGHQEISKAKLAEGRVENQTIYGKLYKLEGINEGQIVLTYEQIDKIWLQKLTNTGAKDGDASFIELTPSLYYFGSFQFVPSKWGGLVGVYEDEYSSGISKLFGVHLNANLDPAMNICTSAIPLTQSVFREDNKNFSSLIDLNQYQLRDIAIVGNTAFVGYVKSTRDYAQVVNFDLSTCEIIGSATVILSGASNLVAVSFLKAQGQNVRAAIASSDTGKSYMYNIEPNCALGQSPASCEECNGKCFDCDADVNNCLTKCGILYDNSTHSTCDACEAGHTFYGEICIPEELAPPPGPVTCSDTDNPNRDYDTCECINAKYGPICDRECHIDCETCDDPTTCKVCKLSKKPDITYGGVCSCQDLPYYNHTNSEWCTSCENAVTIVEYSSDFTEIHITFGPGILTTYTDSVVAFSSKFCEHILQDIPSRKYGLVPECLIDTNVVKIKLGEGSIIQLDQEVLLKPNTLINNNADCTDNSIQFQTFKETNLVLPATTLQPDITSFIKPPEPASICDEIHIEIGDVTNDGGKGLKNFKWSFTSGPSDNQQKIEDLLSTQKQNFIQFPRQLLKQDSSYVFTVYFENFVQKNNTKTVSLSTTSQNSLKISQPASDLKTLKNWKQNDIQINLNYIQCESSQSQTPELKVKWTDITDGINTVLKEVPSTTQPLSIFTHEKFQFTPGIKTFKIDAELVSNSSISATQNIQITFEETPLAVHIKGGNRMTGFTDTLKLEGSAKDLDLPEDQQQIGTALTWNCIDLITNSTCTNADGTPMVLDSEKLQTFPPKTFYPYKTYKLTLQATKGPKSSEDSINLIVTETNLPDLTLEVSDQILNQNVNVNDDLSLSALYSGTSPDIEYTLTVLYKSEIVGQKQFNSPQISYKISDFYSDLLQDDGQIRIQVSLLDPKFIMPSQSSFLLSVNPPPSRGSISVDKTTGQSLSTKFNIQVQDFYDLDSPLTYKYLYYLSPEDQKKENLEGSNLLTPYFNVYQDFTPQNSLQLTLPRAEKNPENDRYDLLILVQVSDARGGVSNTTRLIEVQPPTTDITEQLDQISQEFSQINSLTEQQQIQRLQVLVLELTRIHNSDCTKTNCTQNGSCNKEDKICECNTGFFFKDCSSSQQQTQQKYLEIKQNLQDSLKLHQKNQLLSKPTQIQINKALKYLLDDQDFSIPLNETQIQEQLVNTESNILEQESIIQDILDKNLLNQGDPKSSQKIQQVKQSLGNSLEFLDGIFLGLSIQAEKAENTRRILEESNTTTTSNTTSNNSETPLQSKEQVYNLNKKTGSILQKILLMNADAINFEGKSIKTRVSKNNRDQLLLKFFGIRPKAPVNKDQFSGFDTNNLLNKKNSTDGEQPEEEEPALGIPDSYTGTFENTKNAYRTNPFQKEASFPYQNQSTSLQEYSLNKPGNSTNIKITSNVSMHFGIFQNVDPDYLVCIQKEDEKWNNVQCKTEKTETEDGNTETKCRCSDLSPTTVVKDVENIFQNSKAKDVFDDKAIEAIKDLKFWKTYIFYIYIVKVLILIYCIVKGFKLDKQEVKKQETQEQIQRQLEIEQKQKARVSIMPIALNTSGSNMEKSQNMDIYTPVSTTKRPLQQYDSNTDVMQQYSIQSKQQQTVSPVKRTRPSRIKKFQLQSQQSNVETQPPQSPTKITEQEQNNEDNNENQNNNDNNDMNDVEFQQKRDEEEIQSQKSNQDLPTPEPSKPKAKLNIISADDNDNYEDMIIDSLADEDFDRQTSTPQPQNKKQPQQQQQHQQQEFTQKEWVEVKDDPKEQVIEYPDVELHKKDNTQKKYTKNQLKDISDVILKLHPLFGIFLVYENNLSRPLRFMLYYLRIHQLLACSAFFSQDFNLYESVLFSLICAVFIGIPELILQAMLKKQSKCAKFLGFFIYIIFYLFTVYVMLASVATMKYKKANQWTKTYFLSYSLDQFMMETLANFFKLYTIRLELISGTANCFSKIFGNQKIVDYLKKTI